MLFSAFYWHFVQMFSKTSFELRSSGSMQYHWHSELNAVLLFYDQIVALLLLNHPLKPDYNFKIMLKMAPSIWGTPLWSNYRQIHKLIIL